MCKVAEGHKTKFDCEIGRLSVTYSEQQCSLAKENLSVLQTIGIFSNTCHVCARMSPCDCICHPFSNSISQWEIRCEQTWKVFANETFVPSCSVTWLGSHTPLLLLGEPDWGRKGRYRDRGRGRGREINRDRDCVRVLEREILTTLPSF